MELKEMRKLLGLSQAAFGEKYNIPVRTIKIGRVAQAGSRIRS